MIPKHRFGGRHSVLAASSLLLSALPCHADPPPAPRDAAPAPVPVENVTVTASRRDLIGVAETASQGSVTREELELRPVYRVGQLLESVPGLEVTVHSGEGKANQYLLRGVNLDHGIDFANFIDDIPINRPSNAHGQGYSDLNFIIPQLIGGLDYTKGPYHAAIGDFGAVGSEHLRLVDELPDQISTTLGTLGAAEAYGGGTLRFDDGGRLLGAIDLAHLDGPYAAPDNFRKIALATRYVDGTASDGYSVTAMYFKGQGRNSTDVPQRAIEDGMIGFFGTLDPTDGNQSQRWSFSGHYAASGDDWAFTSNLYYVHSTQVLWNDFTHLLFDPVNGDQEEQDETRNSLGGGVAYTRDFTLGGVESSTVSGVQERWDDEYVDRRHTKARVALDFCNDGDGDFSVGAFACTADKIELNDTGPYFSNTTHWLSWLRTTIGVREEYARARDHELLTGSFGSARKFLFQPKGDVTFGPWSDTEFYVSAGKGFHSDDIRGVLGNVPNEATGLAIGQVPLLARTYGEEFGVRNASIPDLQIQLALFRQDFGSEVIYDQDMGMDQATAPSRREGAEFSAQYHPYPWLELNTDLAATHARFFENATTLAETFGVIGGTFIENAPTYTASFGALVDHLGPWFGGAEQRILGSYPLTDGPGNPRGRGYSQTNADVGYKLTDQVELQLSVYNLFDQRAYAAEFFYATDITAAEVAKFGATGVSDFQVHPLEPLSARLTLTVTF
jgi:outer membrane receptor protein involved in Fe transport